MSRPSSAAWTASRCAGRNSLSPSLAEQILGRELGADPDLPGPPRLAAKAWLPLLADSPPARPAARGRIGPTLADAVERTEQRQRPLAPVRQVAPDRADQLPLLGRQPAELPPRAVKVPRRQRVEHLRQRRRPLVRRREQLPERRQQRLLLGRQLRPRLPRLVQRAQVARGGAGEGGEDTMHGPPTLPREPAFARAPALTCDIYSGCLRGGAAAATRGRCDCARRATANPQHRPAQTRYGAPCALRRPRLRSRLQPPGADRPGARPQRQPAGRVRHRQAGRARRSSAPQQAVHPDEGVPRDPVPQPRGAGHGDGQLAGGRPPGRAGRARGLHAAGEPGVPRCVPAAGDQRAPGAAAGVPRPACGPDRRSTTGRRCSG